MKTYIAAQKEFNAKTYLIDASGKTLGRLATKIAGLLTGKGKVRYSPFQLCGDQVVVIHAEKAMISGKKKSDKLYTRYTGYPGGLRTITYEKLLVKKPTYAIRHAVASMVPNTKLGREMLRRLRVYAGAVHNQQAQKPIELKV